MKTYKTFLSVNRKQFLVYLLLVLGVTAATTVINYSNGPFFERFLGNQNPIIICLAVSIAGFLCFLYLIFKNWFKIYKKKKTGSLALAAGLCVLFPSLVILIDLKVRFPADMNLAFPASLLFYPAIGFIVEILFHILPITLILFFLRVVFKNISIEKSILWVILVVAAFEPTYQAIYLTSVPAWTVISVWLILYLFNLTQLLTFKRFDLVSMYTLRLVYYLIWHILWGYARLTILF